VTILTAGWSQRHFSAGRPQCAVSCLHAADVTADVPPLPVIYQRILNRFTKILHWLVDSNLCQTFWYKKHNFTTNSSKFITCFSETPCSCNYYNSLFINPVIHVAVEQWTCSEISCNVKKNVYLAMEIPDRVRFVSGQIVTK